MKRMLREYRLNLFTFIEILFAFAVNSMVLSVDLGCIYSITEHSAGELDPVMIIILNFFAFFTLFVTAVGVMGIQLIHTCRRTNEIGLHRAVGARDPDIFLLILKDTLYRILLPAAAGTLAGIILSSTLPFDRAGLQVRVNLFLILMCMAALLIFTVLSGMLPAVRAVRMKPMEVLKGNAAVKGRKKGIAYSFCFYLLLLAIISGGAIINHRLEAGYREDLINTAGAPPAATEEVPEFSFENAEGEIISSEALKGQSYCLLLWETSCPVSGEVFEDLKKLQTGEIIDKNNIYTVNIDKSMRAVKKYNRINELTFEPYIDHEKSTKWAFNAGTVPAIYIIDENGIIKARSIGWSATLRDYIIQSMIKTVKNA